MAGRMFPRGRVGLGLFFWPRTSVVRPGGVGLSRPSSQSAGRKQVNPEQRAFHLVWPGTVVAGTLRTCVGIARSAWCLGKTGRPGAQESWCGDGDGVGSSSAGADSGVPGLDGTAAAGWRREEGQGLAGLALQLSLRILPSFLAVTVPSFCSCGCFSFLHVSLQM